MTVMGGFGMAGQDRGPGPTGEKCPCSVLVGREQSTDLTPRCDLCALLRHPHNPPDRRRAPCGTGHGLRIALVDDDEETRLAARRMVQAERAGWALEMYPPSCPVREPSGRKGASRPNALEGDHAPGSPADIVLVGLPHREGSRLGCVRQLKALAPDLPVLIISGDSDEASIVECCAAGADGYVLKPVAAEELARTVSSVAGGWPVLCREAQKAVVDALHRAGTATTVWFPGLSRRELEIAGCLVANLRDKDISERLGMARSTVHVHLARLYRKLRIHSRQQAVARLLRGGGEK